MIDLGPPPFVFPKPAIIRPATADLLRYGSPSRSFLPGLTPVIFSPFRKPIEFVGASVLFDLGATTMAMPEGVEVGDLIIGIHARDAAATHATPDGYDNISSSNSGTPTYNIVRKFMVGSVDANVPRPLASGTPPNVSIAAAFRNVHPTTPLDVAATVTDGGSGMPNPPAITPVTNRAMIVACAMLDDDDIDFTAPDGMQLVDTIKTNVGGVSAGAAYLLQETAAEYDPAVFGGGGNDEWWAVTIALRPAS
jgi:hypothetical protein